jgi:hypothetical protein
VQNPEFKPQSYQKKKKKKKIKAKAQGQPGQKVQETTSPKEPEQNVLKV